MGYILVCALEGDQLLTAVRTMPLSPARVMASSMLSERPLSLIQLPLKFLRGSRPPACASAVMASSFGGEVPGAVAKGLGGVRSARPEARTLSAAARRPPSAPGSENCRLGKLGERRCSILLR